MKLHTLTALLTFVNIATAVHDNRELHKQVAKRQSSASSQTTGSSSSSGSTAGTSTASGTSASSATTPAPATASVVYPTPDSTGVPPLVNITFGMPPGPTPTVTSTYKPGSVPTYSGAIPLPTAFVYSASEWPMQDKVPDTNSSQVAQWKTELDGFDIPTFNPTVDGSCVNDTAATADAANRGWWTCGGYTRPSDIVSCPDKFTWGVSFDDGPAVYTQNLLNYLNKKSILATFFVVGSRVIERPQVLIEEYMSGHEICVHTWSHRHLTSLTNDQIVAELGYTREAIRRVLGVTPTCMRPPFGDIDDRVRAISLAMGLVPIIWTRSPTGEQFDTNDWRVAGNLVTGPSSFASFQQIMGNASLIDSGFIVLQHDLFESTVDLAIGYTLQAALTHSPPFTLEPIGKCSRIPTANLYAETNTNKTFPPFHNTTTNSNNKSTAKGGTSFNGVISMNPVLGLAGGLALALAASFLA